jgi:phage-related protein (TIGR01555 family)
MPKTPEQKVTKKVLLKQNEALKHINAELTSRANLAGALGYSYGTDRDLYAKLGYPRTISYNQYLARYLRQDIAARVINAPVDATWRLKPQVVELTDNREDDKETEFEKQWKELTQRLRMYNRFTRADKLAGLGQYAIIYIGFDDGGRPEDEVTAAKDVLFLQPYSSDSAEIASYISDTTDPRYGYPEYYSVSMSNAVGGNDTSTAVRVHHSRVLHLADGLMENNVLGTPQLENVYNRLQDLETLAGGSAEMFWRGAFTGMVMNMNEDADVDAQSMTDMADEMDDYINGLRRYIRTQGMDVKMLNPTVADPSNHAELQFKLISSAKGIPVRILTGSERGELASTQDASNWHGKIKERQEDYAEPLYLLALIDKLQNMGILNAVEYEVKWPDMLAPSDKEQADIVKTRTEALVAYANAPASEMMMPLEVYLDEVWGFDKAVIERITTLVSLIEEVDDLEDDEPVIEIPVGDDE